MGQPITLHKGSQVMTVYGQQQARIHLAEGWQVAGDSTVVSVAVASLPPVDATDGAVALAQEHGLDLTEIDGSGKNGRILVSDVRRYLDADD